jgi:two-component SAPR family response regulator
VEDDVLVAMTLETILSDAGYSILGPVTTVERAMEIASARPPNIAFLNIHLRDGDSGISLAKMLTLQFGTAVYFASGQKAHALANREYAIGYITKPYSAESILAAVDIANDLRQGKTPCASPEGILLFGASSSEGLSPS